MNSHCKLPCSMHSSSNKMLQNAIGNERFEFRNAANTVNTAASSSKILHIPSKRCCFYEQWEAPKFQLQNVAKKQLKWRLPSAKCCKQQEEQAEKHIQIKQNNSEPFFSSMVPYLRPSHHRSTGSRSCQQQWSGTGFVRLWRFVPLSHGHDRADLVWWQFSHGLCFNSYWTRCLLFDTL